MEEPTLTISAVSDNTGVSQATLRAWQNRYGLAPSRSTEGGHRRYTTLDVERIRAVQRLVAQGIPAGDAARSVLGVAVADALAPQLLLPADTDRAAHLLAAAALDLDGPRARALLREHLVRHGVLATWEDVLRPVLGAVGEQWADLPHGVAVEHLISHLAAVALGESARRRPQSGDRTVLLASAPEEMHDLPLSALAAVLDVTRVTPVLLGARTPLPALVEAVRRHRPRAVVIFAHTPDFADPGIFEKLPDDVGQVAAGPGWLTTDAGVDVVNDLLTATERVMELV